MKKMNVLGVLLAAALLASSLAGCGCFIQAQKGEAPPPPPPEQKALTPPEGKKEVVVPPPAAAPEAVAAAPAPAAPMASLSDIHFDFDRYNIRPGDADILRKNVDWFKADSATKVRIEGNC